jgi:hypothetical protein
MEVPGQTLYKELRSMGQGVDSIHAFDKIESGSSAKKLMPRKPWWGG